MQKKISGYFKSSWNETQNKLVYFSKLTRDKQREITQLYVSSEKVANITFYFMNYLKSFKGILIIFFATFR